MAHRHSLVKFLFSIFLFLIFAFQVSAQENQKIIFKNDYLWELSCADFKDAKVTQGQYLKKSKNINKTLHHKYRIRDDIFEEHYYQEKKHRIESITRISDGAITDITNEVVEEKRSFCQDNFRSPDEKVKIRTKEIYYFEITCVNNEVVPHQIIIDTITNKLDTITSKLYKKIDQDFFSEDIKENIDFLTTDLYQYSKIRNPIKCTTDHTIKFSIKNIKSYLASSEASENGAATAQSDKPDIDCNALDENEILNYPVDCKDVINERKKEKERKKEELKQAEIDEITGELNIFLSKSTSGEWLKILTNEKIIDVKDKNKKLSENYLTLKNKESLKERLDEITKLLKPIGTIIYHYDNYLKVCINQQYPFTNSKADNYTEICKNIENSDFEWIVQKIKDWDLMNDSGLKKEYELLKINVEAEIKNITKENKQKEEEEQSASELIDQINPLISTIKKNINTLEVKIKGDVMDLDVFINNFDINETYSKNYDDLEQSISRKIKLIDGLFIKIGNLIKKFPESYDSSSYQKKKESFSQKIDDLNTEKEKLVKKINTAQSKLKDQADKIRKDKEDKKRLDDLKEQQKADALEQENLKKLEGDIDKKITEIENALKNIKTRISNEIQLINEFIENFNARETYVNNYDNLENEILDQKEKIKSLIGELSTLIKKLPKDYDDEDYADQRRNRKDDLKDIDEDTETLNEKITSAKSLLESQDDKIEELLKKQDLLITQLNNRITILENNKTTSEKDLLEKLTTSKNDNTTLRTDKENLGDTIKLRDGTIKNNIRLIIILIVILVISLGLIIYLFVRRKSSKDDDASANTRKHLSRIDELERELENKNASLRSQVKASDAPILEREPEKKEEVVAPPPDPQKEKYNELMKLYKDYDAAMKDPNQVEVFMKAYNAEGLEREARLASKGKTTLRKVNKPFHRADFWLVQHDNKWLIFGGRILKIQAPSFLADDGTRARNLMQGIFQLEFGIDFKTVRCAIVNKINQIYEVRTEGKLQLPKIDS